MNRVWAGSGTPLVMVCPDCGETLPRGTVSHDCRELPPKTVTLEDEVMAEHDKALKFLSRYDHDGP